MDLTAGKSLKTEKHRRSIRREEMNTISRSAKKRDATRMRGERAERRSKRRNGVLAPLIGSDQPADVPERNSYATPESQLPTEKEKDNENWMDSIQLDDTPLFQPRSSNASCSSTSAHQTATPLTSKPQRDPPDHSDPDPPDSDDSFGSDDYGNSSDEFSSDEDEIELYPRKVHKDLMKVQYPFDGTKKKYWKWKDDITNHLDSYGLAEYLLIPVPQVHRMRSAMRFNAKKVYCFLFVCLQRNAKLKIAAPFYKHKPHRVWLKLEDEYDKKTMASLLDLTNELMTLKKKENETVNDYVSRGMALAIESAENDEPVSEHRMMALLLRGLGPEFQPMETLKYQKDLSFEDLVDSLAHFEEKVLSKYGKESGFGFPPRVGLLAEAKEEKRWRTGKKFKPGDRRPDGSTVRQGHCHWCGVTGHWKDECRRRRSKESPRPLLVKHFSHNLQ